MSIKDNRDARERSEQFPDTRICGLETSSSIFLRSVKYEAFLCGINLENVEESRSVVLNSEV